MLFRSLVFNLLMYVSFIIVAVAFSPVLLMPERFGWWVARLWVGIALWLHRVICRIDERVIGAENAPRTSCIVACKHQSTWETMALVRLLDRPAFVYKRELGWLPFFGWYLLKLGSIPIDRSKRSKALDSLTTRARRAIDEGRQVVIFPEGTRRPPGAEPRYRYGVTRLYAKLGVACVPIAVNSGLFWPRRSTAHRPGTIIAEFLPPIPPGMPANEFAGHLQDVIETASSRLLDEAAQDEEPPLPQNR